MRKRLYEIVEQSTENDKASKVYDIFMMVVILSVWCHWHLRKIIMLF